MSDHKFPNRQALVAGIFKQTEGEENAKKEYMEFLSCAGDMLQPKDKAILQEVIEDEMNHVIKLLAMAKKYSGFKPTPDDLPEALEFLGK